VAKDLTGETAEVLGGTNNAKTDSHSVTDNDSDNGR
jgi:hypothetical protein